MRRPCTHRGHRSKLVCKRRAERFRLLFHNQPLLSQLEHRVCESASPRSETLPPASVCGGSCTAVSELQLAGCSQTAATIATLSRLGGGPLLPNQFFAPSSLSLPLSPPSSSPPLSFLSNAPVQHVSSQPNLPPVQSVVIISANVNGISRLGNFARLVAVLFTHRPHVVLLQETWLSADTGELSIQCMLQCKAGGRTVFLETRPVSEV